MWADTRGLLELAAREDAELGRLQAVVPREALAPVAAGLSANGEELAVEVATRENPGVEAAGTPLVQELPGDTWAAAGVADLGETVADALSRFAGPFGAAAARAQVKGEVGLDLDRDVLDWIGHSAFFLRGTDPERMDGGLVIQPASEERAEAAFGRILGALQRETGARARPIEVAGADQAFALEDMVFARGPGRVVLTLGQAAAEAALGSDDRLGDTDLYAEADELALGEPSLLVAMPQLLELLGASGHPDVEQARPYLEAFSVLAVGVSGDSEGYAARLGAGLR